MARRSLRFYLLPFLLITFSYCAAQNTKENADFKLAVNLFNDKVYDLSLEQFRQFISSYPSSPQSIEAKFYIGLTYRALKKNDDARTSFQGFALTYADHPKAPDAWWNVGELFAEEKKFAEAGSSFERIKVFQPKSKLAPKALLSASNYFELAGDNDNSKRCLRSLVSDYPTNDLVPEAHARLGTSYMKENNFLAARKELLLAVEGGVDKEMNAVASIQLAKIAQATGNPAETEQRYQSVMAAAKSDISAATIARARLELGRFYYSSGRKGDAIDCFQKLLADSTKFSSTVVQEALLAQGVVYSSNREYKKAADSYERCARIGSDSSIIVQALFGAGQAYDGIKDYRKSLSSFSSVSAVAPAGPEKKYALLRAAAISASLNRAESAIQFFSLYAELFPNDDETPEVLFRSAELSRLSTKDLQKSVELYSAFLIKYPKHEKVDDATFALALAYEALQDFPGALKTYTQLAEKYPSSTFAPSAIERRAFLQNYKSPDKEQTVKQLALLLGDLILERQRSELAVRLGDIYLNVLQDFPQAAMQYQKAIAMTGAGFDSTAREETAYKRTVAMRRQSELDSSYVSQAISTLTSFLKEYPSGKFSDEAAFNRFLLQSRAGSVAAKAELALQFLKERRDSRFASRVLLSLGTSQKERGLLTESIETFRRIANRYPTQSEAEEATAQLGIQLAHLGKSDTAAVVLSDYLRAYPRGFFNAEILYETGMLSLREEKFLVAATSFEQLRSRYFYSSRAVECTEALAQSYQKTHQFDRAVTLYRQVLDRASSPLQTGSKGREQTMLQLARAYDEANDTTNARKWYLSYLGEEPQPADAADAYARLALFQRQAGDETGAAQFLEKSVASRRTARNTAELSSLYYMQNDFARAIDEYTELLVLADVDSTSLRSARVHIITALYRSDKRKEAEKKTTEFLKLYGADKSALGEFEFERAMALYRDQEFDRAISVLASIPSKYDSTEIIPQASFWTAKILEAKELPDSALKQYDLLMRTFPNSEIMPKVYLALGNIFFFKENYDEAVKYYRLIVDKPKLSPDVLPFAMSNLIAAYKEVGLFDGALELTRNFIERYPADESILDKKVDMGILYQKLGYYDQAIVQLQSLLETTNKDLESEIRYYLGESYYYKGDYQQAILEFLKVPYLITKKTKIDWTPNSYYMSAQSYEKMGKFDQALNMYQQIIDKSGIDPAFKTAAQKEINRVKSVVKKDSN